MRGEEEREEDEKREGEEEEDELEEDDEFEAVVVVFIMRDNGVDGVADTLLNQVPARAEGTGDDQRQVEGNSRDQKLQEAHDWMKQGMQTKLFLALHRTDGQDQDSIPTVNNAGGDQMETVTIFPSHKVWTGVFSRGFY